MIELQELEGIVGRRLSRMRDGQPSTIEPCAADATDPPGGKEDARHSPNAALQPLQQLPTIPGRRKLIQSLELTEARLKWAVPASAVPAWYRLWTVQLPVQPLCVT